jgi:hypothetical protein
LQLLSLVILNKYIEVICNHPYTYEILAVNFNAFRCRENTPSDTVDLQYQVGFDESSNLYSIITEPNTILTTPLPGKFLYWIEKEITISLQRMRPDLYFLHAAVLEYDGYAFILTGSTGSGKSTMTWALLNHNFGYMSDELAPIDIRTMNVQPFPHALCLKNEPAVPYIFPSEVLTTERASHIPTINRDIEVITQPMPLKTIFFIQHQTESKNPSYRKLHKAEAAMRLYTNALNPLAHDNAGLNSATAIVSSCACYELITADLSASCELVKQCLEVEKSVI